MREFRALKNPLRTSLVPVAATAPTPAPGPVLDLPAGGSPAAAAARKVRLRGMIDAHIDFVARILRNAGTPEAEVDDEVQRTFIVAAKRLDDVRLGAERSFLAQIALHLAAHARRTLARRREVAADEAPEPVESFATPEQLTDQKRVRQMLDRILDQMETNLRTVLVLHEFEEMNMAEIADILSIPRGTVASRLRRARSDFRGRVRALERATKIEGNS